MPAVGVERAFVLPHVFFECTNQESTNENNQIDDKTKQIWIAV